MDLISKKEAYDRLLFEAALWGNSFTADGMRKAAEIINFMECEPYKLIKEIADHYGFTSQANMLCEESAEYMVALNKFRRGKAEAYENIKEEVADIIVVALQLYYLLGAEDIDKIIDSKIERQLDRIDLENTWASAQRFKEGLKDEP